jgi:nucleotide-binding universal stress UspA family protein
VHVVQALEGGIDSERHVVDEAVELLREEGVAVTSTVQVGEPHEVIQAECQEKGFGLVAVGYRGRVNLPGRVLGRVTESLVDELESALLVAR